MGILDISNRKLALCYTHIAYRNTALEDYHSQNVIMDDDFYNIIYEIVSKQIKRIKRNQKILVQINRFGRMQHPAATNVLSKSKRVSGICFGGI